MTCYSNFKFFVLFIFSFSLVMVFGCGRRDPIPDCPPPPTPTCEDCSAVKAELAVLKAAAASLAKAATVVVEDERLCTLEYAKSKDLATLEVILAKQADAEAGYKILVDAQHKKMAEADALPPPPIPDFPAGPSTDWEIAVQTVGMKAVFDKEGCHLREVAGQQRRAFGGSSKWTSFIREVMDKFQDDSEDDLEYDDYRSSIGTIELFNEGAASGRLVADQVMNILVKNGESMKWAVGLVMHLSPKKQSFVMVRLQRLYKASETDFDKLSKDLKNADAYYRSTHEGEVRQDEVDRNLPVEFQFGPSASAIDGNYYKGLLLRYWRWKESEAKGAGNKFIHDLQKVMKEVAKGMKVNLQ